MVRSTDGVQLFDQLEYVPGRLTTTLHKLCKRIDQGKGAVFYQLRVDLPEVNGTPPIHSWVSPLFPEFQCGFGKGQVGQIKAFLRAVKSLQVAHPAFFNGEYTHLDHDLILHVTGKPFSEPGVVAAHIRQDQVAEFMGRGPIIDKVLQRVLWVDVKVYTLGWASLSVRPGHGFFSVADAMKVDMDIKRQCTHQFLFCRIGDCQPADQLGLLSFAERVLPVIVHRSLRR